MSERSVGDLSRLPAAGFSTHGLWWWAAAAFMLMETAGFSLAAASYLYVMSGAERWPLEAAYPDLFWGTAQTVLLLGSLVPTWFFGRAARRREPAGTRFWGVVVALLNGLALVIRAVEFPHLNVRWDHDAYGSVTWALMLLHTTHLITDFLDTAFLVVFLFTHPLCDERYSDADDDCVYWAFVVMTWIPLYLLVYWAPRWAT